MVEVQGRQKFTEVAQKIEPHGKLLRAQTLTGGVSAQVTALEIALADGQLRKVVVRQHGETNLRSNPDVAADEYKLLQILQSAGIPAPAPYYLDQSGEIFDTPYLVIEFMEGSAEDAPANLADLTQQLATQLARIHALNRSQFPFLPDHEKSIAAKLRERSAQLDVSLNEGRIRDALESVCPLPQHNQSALLHGDFWPGNILWREGQLAAVLDWEDAAVGDPLADVGNARLELLWAFGMEAMEQFTENYKSMTTFDFTHLPYWDLDAALRPAGKLSAWGLDEARERRMRTLHYLFVKQAFKKLP